MKKLSILILPLFFLSCSSFLEEYSQDLAKVESYTDLDELLLGDCYLTATKAVFKNSYLDFEESWFQAPHYMSDELEEYMVTEEGDAAGVRDGMFGWHAWQRQVGLAETGNARAAENKDWHKAYHCINTANSVIALIDDQHAGNESDRLAVSRIKGEAYFLRALYYFTLVNMYGKPYCTANLSAPAVPLKLSSYVEDKEYVLNTVEEVYAQVIDDLNIAEECLEKTPQKNHPYRADLTAVYLLKSRVYLYKQEWKNAYDYAEKVLQRNNGLLDLNGFNTASGNVLSKSSVETIFSMGGYILAPSIYNTRRTSYGKLMSLPVYLISDDLAAAYEEEWDEDLRTRYYVGYDSVGTGGSYQQEVVFKKIKGYTDWNQPCEVSDYFLFRTAEAYLNGAEAAAYLNEEGKAKELLQTLRDHRFSRSRTLTESGEALVTLIREERQRELCLEGHRWNDLRRYTVCEKYPYSKVIEHTYTSFDANGPVYTRYFQLEANDEAYTLAIPQEVLDFQNTLGRNNRPERPGTQVTYERIDYKALGLEHGNMDGYADGVYARENGLSYKDGRYGDNYELHYNYDYDSYDDYFDGYYDGYNDGYERGYYNE